MTDDKDIVRNYSQDRPIYRRSSISPKRKTSTQFTRTSENYYSNRNCPEILSLYALNNKQLEKREKQIYHSLSNDTHYFNMINYPIQSSPPTPPLNQILKNDNQQNKQPIFPKVTPRTISTTVKKFPSLTSRSTSIVHNKTPMPTIKTSVKSNSSSLNKPSQTKMPIVSIEKKKKIQLSHELRPLK